MVRPWVVCAWFVPRAPRVESGASRLENGAPVLAWLRGQPVRPRPGRYLLFRAEDSNQEVNSRFWLRNCGPPRFSLRSSLSFFWFLLCFAGLPFLRSVLLCFAWPSVSPVRPWVVLFVRFVPARSLSLRCLATDDTQTKNKTDARLHGFNCSKLFWSR